MPLHGRTLLCLLGMANGVRLIDVFVANDEVDMVRYRLRLHASVTARTIIAESNLTHTGKPKPLHIRAALTDEELRRYNVRLLSVPFSSAQLSRANCSRIQCAYVLEIGQRHFVNRVIAEEIAALEVASAGRSHRSPQLLVHSSDVDELIDPQVVARLTPGATSNASTLAEDGRAVRRMLWSEGERFGCVSPRLRVFMYGEHCAIERLTWARSTLFTTAWFNATSATTAGSEPRERPIRTRPDLNVRV